MPNQSLRHTIIPFKHQRLDSFCPASATFIYLQITQKRLQGCFCCVFRQFLMMRVAHQLQPHFQGHGVTIAPAWQRLKPFPTWTPSITTALAPTKTLSPIRNRLSSRSWLNDSRKNGGTCTDVAAFTATAARPPRIAPISIMVLHRFQHWCWSQPHHHDSTFLFDGHWSRMIAPGLIRAFRIALIQQGNSWISAILFDHIILILVKLARSGSISFQSPNNTLPSFVTEVEQLLPIPPSKVTYHLFSFLHFQ